jgi:hypothetical protein
VGAVVFVGLGVSVASGVAGSLQATRPASRKNRVKRMVVLMVVFIVIAILRPALQQLAYRHSFVLGCPPKRLPVTRPLPKNYTR